MKEKEESDEEDEQDGELPRLGTKLLQRRGTSMTKKIALFK